MRIVVRLMWLGSMAASLAPNTAAGQPSATGADKTPPITADTSTAPADPVGAHDLAPSPSVLKIREDALKMRELVASPLAADFLRASEVIPSAAPRDILIDRENRRYLTPAEAESTPEPARGKLERRTLDESFYYNTKYGSPLAYARALDLLAAAQGAEAWTSLAGRRILDFGYGNIGQLHLMAGLSGRVVGVDVDPLLVAYYRQFDEALFKDGAASPTLGIGLEKTAPGSIRLVHGHWPADEETTAKVGGGYDLFITKNTLKRGYVHPEREADPRTLIDLGVSDEQYLARLFEMLKPGGWAMIYNICPAPAPADKPYIPWADGRCPFSEEAIKAAGFEVAVYNRDDSEAARRMALALGWDGGKGPSAVENDIFAWCTLLRKPAAATGTR